MMAVRSSSWCHLLALGLLLGLLTVSDGFKLNSPCMRICNNKASSLLSRQPFIIPRGGGRSNDLSAGKGKKARDTLPEDSSKALQIAVSGVVAAAAVWFAWDNREAIARLFDKQRLQDAVLRILQRVKDYGRVQGLSIYVVGMAIWEMTVGATIPVETAAGMAFGFKTAFIASAGGKMLGALLAFWLGRYFLSEWTQEKLQDNTVMQLIDDSVEDHPLRTTFLFKYSCFPEFVKNFGTSILLPVKTWMFFLATAIHGWMYTALWTYLGADTAAHLHDEMLPPNRFLHALLVLAAIVGFVGSPSLMAWWIRDLRHQSERNEQRRNNKR